MIDGDVFVTPHAVRQYQHRTRAGRELSFEAARAHLVEQVSKARPVKRTSNGAAVLFRGPKPERLRLIVGPGHGQKPALVTVLTMSDTDRIRKRVHRCHLWAEPARLGGQAGSCSEGVLTSATDDVGS